jgi:hypothetical protein
MRQIILDRNPELFRISELADWRYFDLVTEVNDDIDDVYEDIETINANAFLISINESSIKSTRKDFTDFLKKIEYKSKERSKRVVREDFGTIHNWTMENIRSTKKLMDQRLEMLSSKAIDTKSKLDYYANKE